MLLLLLQLIVPANTSLDIDNTIVQVIIVDEVTHADLSFFARKVLWMISLIRMLPRLSFNGTEWILGSENWICV